MSVSMALIHIASKNHANFFLWVKFDINQNRSQFNTFADKFAQVTFAGDQFNTPNMVEEKIDCRICYTTAMIQNTAMWEAAAGVAFQGKAYVAGETSQGMVRARGDPKMDVVEIVVTFQAAMMLGATWRQCS